MDVHALILPPLLAVHLLAVQTAAGALFFLHVGVGPAWGAAGVPAELDGWTRKLVLACLGVALVSQSLWLGVVAASLSGADLAIVADPAVLSVVLRQTEFGVVWLGRTGLCLLLILMVVLLPIRRSLAEDNLPWVGLLLLTFGLSGHAGAGEGSHHGVMLTVMALHLGAGAAWIGSLPVLVRLVVRGGQGDGSAVDDVFARYASYGGWTVTVLVVSGVALAAMMSGGRAAAVHSAFAGVLAGKLALFALMGGLALANRLWLVPALRQPGRREAALARLSRVVLMEYGVGSLVLLAAAILDQTPPPG